MMSGGREVDVEEAGLIFKYMYALNLKASFFPVSITLRSGVQNCSRVL